MNKSKLKKLKSDLKAQKQTAASFTAMAREFAAEGLVALYDMALTASDPWLKLAAWRVLLEYGFGKPKQTVVADVAHSFVLRAPETITDADAWEAKWGSQLACRGAGCRLCCSSCHGGIVLRPP
jgi:hypothetical protein